MSETENTQTFTGFDIPKKNYFPMPNEWINICAGIESLAELKVVQYVLRHTWGFQEYSGTPKPITTDEFMNGRKRTDGSRIDKGTGLSNRSVIDGLRKAIDDGLLTCTSDEMDKGRIVKAYALRMSSDVKNLHRENKENTYEESSQVVCSSFIGDVKNLHSNYEDSSHRSEKDTKEKHLGKTPKEKQEERERANAPDANASTHTQLSQENVSVVSTQEKTPQEKPVKPQQKKPVSPKVVAPSKPVVTLDTPEQIAFWDRWCKVWFNAEMPPTLNDTAKTHIVKLAPLERLKTDETLNSLVAFAKKELEANTGMKKKTIALGNLVGSYSRWVQTQQEQATTPPPAKVVMDHDASCKLAHEIIEQGKRTGYPIQALAGQSVNNPDVWVVNVKWENRFNIVLRPIRSPKHWEERFHDMHESLTAITPNMYAAGVR